jgi:hypothetical protein
LFQTTLPERSEMNADEFPNVFHQDQMHSFAENLSRHVPLFDKRFYQCLLDNEGVTAGQFSRASPVK